MRSLSCLGGLGSVVISPSGGLELGLGRFERNTTRDRLKLLMFLCLKYYVRECDHSSTQSAKPLTIRGSGERRNLPQRGLELGLGRIERNATRSRLKLLKYPSFMTG